MDGHPAKIVHKPSPNVSGKKAMPPDAATLDGSPIAFTRSPFAGKNKNVVVVDCFNLTQWSRSFSEEESLLAKEISANEETEAQYQNGHSKM